jgi:hypothetical protein
VDAQDICAPVISELRCLDIQADCAKGMHLLPFLLYSMFVPPTLFFCFAVVLCSLSARIALLHAKSRDWFAFRMPRMGNRACMALLCHSGHLRDGDYSADIRLARANFVARSAGAPPRSISCFSTLFVRDCRAVPLPLPPAI